MKNVFRVFGIITLTAIIGFTIIACEPVEDVIHADLIGTWNHKSNGTSMIISADEIEVKNDLGTSLFIARIDSSREVTNSGANSQAFPSGFSLTTVIVESYSQDNPEGASRPFTMYLSNDSRSFLIGTSEYRKQRNINTPNDQGISVSDFYATWTDTDFPQYTFIISATELIENINNAVNYKAKFVSVVDAENVDANRSDYPTGFIFVFEVTESNDQEVIVGTKYVYRFFMHNTDRKKIEQVVYSNGVYSESYFLTKP